MTCVFMEGFESVSDASDLLTHGWSMGQIAATAGQNAQTVPSRTGVAGKGLMLRGPYATANPAYLPLCGAVDFGMIDTGNSINSLWKAGGFAVGFNASFNKGTQIQVAPNQASQIVYDGTKYWAILIVAAAYVVGYSTDLQNWTQCATSPTMGMGAVLSVKTISGVVTLALSWHNGATAYTNYISVNGGATWTALASAGVNTRGVSLTGNAAVPAIGMTAISSTGFRVGYYTSLAASSAPTSLSSPSVYPNSTYQNAFTKLVGNVFLAVGGSPSAGTYSPQSGSSQFGWCMNTADMTNTANWTTGPTCNLGEVNDVIYFNNVWLAAGYGGVSSCAQAGTTGSPQGPSATGGWSTVLSVPSYAVWGLATNGTVVVAVGEDPSTPTLPAVWSSSDGVTWTKQNRFVFSQPLTQNGNNFTSVLWDGARFIMTGGMGMNLIATSPDGVAWTSIYTPEYTEATGTSSGSQLGVYSGTLTAGQYVGGAQSAAGSYVPYTTSSSLVVGIGFTAAAVSGSTRSVTGTALVGGTTTTTVSNNVSSAVTTLTNTHFLEIIATATATTNTFTFQYAIDGVMLPGSWAAAFASTGDTTGAAHLLINLPRSGNFTVIDDIYVTTMNGVANVGQLGSIAVVPWTPATVVSSQFTQTGSAANNAVAVAGPLSNSENSVYSTTVGAKDVYAPGSSIPTNFKVRAVQAEAFFSMYGPVGATANVGVISNGVESDSTTVNATTATPTFAKVLVEHDPNTSAAWTNAAANAANIAINKVT